MPFFVALASADHLICWLYFQYRENFTRWCIFELGCNPLRWAEYSVSASSMALAIAILCRITDVHIWFFIFFSTLIGMACGLVLELLPHPTEDKNLPPLPMSFDAIRKLIFSVGSLAVFSPWLVMLCYFFKAAKNSDDMPDFVYAALLLTLILFVCFGLNAFFCQVLGWYPFHKAEMIYIILSFTAKTFLAADVFGGLKAAED